MVQSAHNSFARSVFGPLVTYFWLPVGLAVT